MCELRSQLVACKVCSAENKRLREALLRISPKDSHHGRCVLHDPDDPRAWCVNCYVHHSALIDGHDA